MYYYVYKITNKLNGKFYIGKRCHKSPTDDNYMGSGKLIKQSIAKYGKDNFIKEILSVFNTNEEASKLESELVTKETVKSVMSYNMHEGGHGGFAHINDIPIEDRVNIRALREKIENGEISCGGIQHWTKDSWDKVLYQSFGERAKRGEFNPNTWQGLTEEEYNTRISKLSESSKGSKNSQYGKRKFINPLTKECVKVKPENAPIGYILFSEYEKERLKNSNVWFNDGKNNYYIKQNDDRIKELGLIRGRLNAFSQNNEKNI